MIQEKAEESLGVGALIDEDVTVSLNKLLPFKELALVHMAEYKQNMQAGLETHICVRGKRRYEKAVQQQVVSEEKLQAMKQVAYQLAEE